jgi:CheY-like chemotaxis protein
MKRIFFLDDDDVILESFAMIFSDMGFEVVTCSNAAEGINIASSGEFDLILSDVRMPELNGAEVVRKLRTLRPGARIFVMTAYPGDPLVQVALEAGAQGVMKKPFEIAKILDLLKD